MTDKDKKILKLISLFRYEGSYCFHSSLTDGDIRNCNFCSREINNICKSNQSLMTVKAKLFDQARKELSEIDKDLLFKLLI